MSETELDSNLKKGNGKTNGNKKKFSVKQSIMPKIDKMSKAKSGRTAGIVLFLILSGSILGLVLGQNAGWFSAFKPELDSEADYTGYAVFKVYVINETSGEPVEIEARADFLDYETEELITSENVLDGDIIFKIDQTTLIYITEVVDSNGIVGNWRNFSFVTFANDDIDDPYVNTIVLNEFASSGDLEAAIWDLNSVHNVYDIADFVSGENSFTLHVNNTSDMIMGIPNYIPESYRIAESVSHLGLWVGFDEDIENMTINGYEPFSTCEYNGLTYFDIGIIGSIQDIDIVVNFVSSLPTEMNFYDGIPTDDYLILTI